MNPAGETKRGEEGPGGIIPRPLLFAAIAGLAILMGSACGRSSGLDTKGGGGDGTPLTPSPAWQRVVDAEVYRDRLASLGNALDRLRRATRSGWIGRQDDVTGYLGELTGGTFGPVGTADPEAVGRAFLDGYGPDLFGVSSSEVEWVAAVGPSPQDPAAVVVLRGEQRVHEVPVVDSSLVATVATRGGAPQLQALTGRVFPGLEVDPVPAVGRSEAISVVEQTSGGHLDGEVRVVVLPLAAPAGGPTAGTIEARLAWEVPVSGDTITGGFGASIYLVDAVTGGILTVRPGAADAGMLQPIRGVIPSVSLAAEGSLPPVGGEPIQVSGIGPIGEAETANAVRTPDGTVLLLDTIGPDYDPATGSGVVETHDASAGGGALPGPLVAFAPGAPTDPEALAAQALGRVVLDYYRSVHGRRSWDGQGGSLISSVHFGGPGFCNSFFNGEQMVYGTPCQGRTGPASATEVEIDTAGHEITHGVTATAVGGGGLGLVYTGQSGAMNESFSDYFGNVIGNRLKGIDTAQMFEGSCTGVAAPTAVCRPDPSGGFSLRYLLNGNTFDDYLYLLDPSLHLQLAGVGQDHGGVHLNSSIWNNALWAIRTQLALMDGMTGNDSPRARLFDAIVYAALTRHLFPTSGFLDGRTAVELAARQLGAGPEILRVIRQEFDRDGICAGCIPDPVLPGALVAGGTQSEKLPVAAGPRTAWLDFSSGGGGTAIPVVVDQGGDPVKLSELPTAFSVAFAGTDVVTAELADGIVRYPAGGGREVLDAMPLDNVGFSSRLVGVAGSPDGAAWVDRSSGTVGFVDANGEVTTASLGSLAFEPFGAIATGGRTVVLGSDRGTVVVWTVGAEPLVVTRLRGPVVAVAADGDVVVATALSSFDITGTVWLFRPSEAADQGTKLSEHAAPFGLAASGGTVVWPEGVGDLTGGVARQLGVALPDTDLVVYDLATASIRAVIQERGQQGYPSLDGSRLVWQDAARGGDDVRSMDLAVVP